MIEIAGQLGTKFNTRAAIWQGCQGAAKAMDGRERPFGRDAKVLRSTWRCESRRRLIPTPGLNKVHLPFVSVSKSKLIESEITRVTGMRTTRCIAIERIVLVMLTLGALELAGCASNPNQPAGYAPSGSYGGAYYGYGEGYGNPGYYGYGYGSGYAYPYYPGMWIYSPPPAIGNNPPGITSPPSPHPALPSPPPPGLHRPFIKPAPPMRAHNDTHTSPP